MINQIHFNTFLGDLYPGEWGLIIRFLFFVVGRWASGRGGGRVVLISGGAYTWH